MNIKKKSIIYLLLIFSCNTSKPSLSNIKARFLFKFDNAINVDSINYSVLGLKGTGYSLITLYDKLVIRNDSLLGQNKEEKLKLINVSGILRISNDSCSLIPNRIYGAIYIYDKEVHLKLEKGKLLEKSTINNYEWPLMNFEEESSCMLGKSNNKDTNIYLPSVSFISIPRIKRGHILYDSMSTEDTNKLNSFYNYYQSKNPNFYISIDPEENIGMDSIFYKEYFFIRKWSNKPLSKVQSHTLRKKD